MKKLTKRNQEYFFHTYYSDGKSVVPGEMFTASKNYQYAEIQELAGLEGVAARRVNLEDMAALKEKNNELYRIIKTTYWEVDAKSLYICITREEYLERVQEYEKKKQEQMIKWRLESVDTWFEEIVHSLEWVIKDVSRNREQVKEAIEKGEGIGYRAQMEMEDTVNRLKGIHFNLPIDRVIRLILELREVLPEEQFKSPWR